MDHPLGRVEEYIDIVRAAMRGEKLNFTGKYFTAQNFKMAFKPSGRVIPVYLAAFGPKMSRLAGRISDGVLINMANPAEIRRIAGLKRCIRAAVEDDVGFTRGKSAIFLDPAFDFDHRGMARIAGD